MMENSKNNNIQWMPIQEYELHKELMNGMTLEERIRMAYFFWNNFSHEGEDEYIEKLKKGEIQDKDIS